MDNIFEKYTLDAPAIKQAILYLLDMAGFGDSEILQVVIQKRQIVICPKEGK